MNADLNFVKADVFVFKGTQRALRYRGERSGSKRRETKRPKTKRRKSILWSSQVIYSKSFEQK